MQEPFTLQDYRIGTFAKRMGVSPHFLKYYEEAGILKPRVRENGYRYYTLWDASIVMECKQMKNMGFSVKESGHIVTQGTADALAQLLEQHERQLDAEAERKRRTVLAMENLRAALRFCAREEWNIRTAEPRWFLPHTSEQRFSEDPGVYAQLPDWVEAMPIVRSAQRLTRRPDGSWKPEWGLCVRAQDAAAAGLSPAPPAVLLPAVRVFEQYTSYRVDKVNAGPQHDARYARLMARLAAMHLTPGPVMSKEMVACTLQGGVRQLHCILRVPVTAPDEA